MLFPNVLFSLFSSKLFGFDSFSSSLFSSSYLDKLNTRYKVVSPKHPKTNEKIASLIADAILMDLQVTQLVALFGDNNLETEKDWELMSELDKDELIRKKIVVNYNWTVTISTY